MEKKIHVTGDGSHTLFVPELNEFYHSAKGAYSESMHVFINRGLKEVTNRKKLNILEIGFGTGLNCLLTFIEAEKNDLHVFYDALEPYPLDWDLVSKLNYTSIIQYNDAEKLLKTFHQSEWDSWVDFNDWFSLRKSKIRIEDVKLDFDNYDLVYYDAFGPGVQSEMWMRKNFLKVFQSMKRGGVLVTYCAKGQVRRDMENTGFFVERLPGTSAGKREMIRAFKK